MSGRSPLPVHAQRPPGGRSALPPV